MSVSKKKEPSELQFRNGSSGGVDLSPTSSDSNKKIFSGQLIEDSEQKEFNTKFVPKMIAKSVLSDSFLRIGIGKSSIFGINEGFEPLHIGGYKENRFGFTSRGYRVSQCGRYLYLAHGIYETGEIDEHGRLVKANFCKDRLCPMCNWRRSLKIYGQCSKIMDVIAPNYKFLFLTLTVPNCAPEDLKTTLDDMNDGFYRMKRTKRFKDAVRGFHRVTEVTINQKNETYHPHFHIILAVDKDYCDYHSSKYIPHAEWLSMWQDAMRDCRINQVNIKVIKPKLKDGKLFEKSMHEAVAEVSKYAVKSSDFLGKFDDDGNLIKAFSDDVIDKRVFTLAAALSGRQLSVFGGVFSDTQKALNLDDAEDGDLVHLQDDKYNHYIAELIIRFEWRAGIGNYKKVACDIVRREQNKNVS